MLSPIFAFLVSLSVVTIASGVAPVVIQYGSAHKDASEILRFMKNGGLTAGDIGPIEFPISIIPKLFPNLTESDPWAFQDKSFNFNSNILRGSHSYWASRAVGHSGIGEALWMTLVEGEDAIRLKYVIDLASFTLDGSYLSDLEILNGFIYFSGDGLYSTGFTNTTITIEAKVTSTSTPSIILDNLEFGLRFRQLDMFAQNALVNCEPPIWSEIGYELALIVETFAPVASVRVLAPLLTPVLNRMLADCDLEEIIFEGDMSCIKPGAGEPLKSAIQEAAVEILSLFVANRPRQSAKSMNPCVPEPNQEVPSGTEAGIGGIETTPAEGNGGRLVSSVMAVVPPVLLTLH